MLKQFLRQQHILYLEQVQQNKDFFNYGQENVDHLSIPGAYWSITSCYLIKKNISKELQQELLDWIKSCQNQDGGYGGNTNHDSQITSTLYALIIFLLFDQYECIDRQKTLQYVLSLYDEETGGYRGNIGGEIDGRFVYSAIYCLKILNEKIPKKCIQFFRNCQNFDGGFGGCPGAESHAAYTFCAIGAISMMNKLEFFDLDRTLLFLSIRQTSCGGFNGRPEKLPDVCYSWWVLSAIRTITKIKTIDEQKLVEYILTCQDKSGGFSDRPGNGNDVFHTFFSLAGLSLIDNEKFDLTKIDCVYAIPETIKNKYINNQSYKQKLSQSFFLIPHSFLILSINIKSVISYFLVPNNKLYKSVVSQDNIYYSYAIQSSSLKFQKLFLANLPTSKSNSNIPKLDDLYSIDFLLDIKSKF